MSGADSKSAWIRAREAYNNWNYRNKSVDSTHFVFSQCFFF